MGQSATTVLKLGWYWWLFKENYKSLFVCKYWWNGLIGFNGRHWCL